MDWKNWSYWLRGGVIGLIVGVLFLALTFFNILKENFLYSFVFLLGKFLNETNFPANAWVEVLFIWIPLTTLAQSFIIGAIIGFITGKIKNRK